MNWRQDSDVQVYTGTPCREFVRILYESPSRLLQPLSLLILHGLQSACAVPLYMLLFFPLQVHPRQWGFARVREGEKINSCNSNPPSHPPSSTVHTILSPMSGKEGGGIIITISSFRNTPSHLHHPPPLPISFIRISMPPRYQKRSNPKIR